MVGVSALAAGLSLSGDYRVNQHPLSSAFPAMHPADFAALCEDVAQHGLRQPVVTYCGEVLDGWHRYRACIETGEKPTLVELAADVDPVAFVLSLNLSRRHLTGAQRAEAVVRCRAWAPPDVRPTRGAPRAPVATVAEMAEEAGVGDRTVQYVKRAHEAGLGDAIRDGKVSAKRAAAIAKLPQAERAAAIEAPPEKRVKAVVDAPEEVDSGDAERMADMVRDYEAALKIIESDDAVNAAWDEVRDLTRKLADMTRLYEAKCGELAEMTREAKRWKRKAEDK